MTTLSVRGEGCQLNVESGEEILKCDKLGKNDKQADYTWFYSELVSKQIMVGKIMVHKLKKRKQIKEEVENVVHPNAGCWIFFV